MFSKLKLFSLVMLVILVVPKISYADRIIEVVFLRTAENNGSNPSLATAEEFKKQIDTANQAYAGSGIQFKFDPIKGFPPIVNNTFLHRDWILAKGATLNSPKDKPPKVDDRIFTISKNEYIQKNYPGKMVVLSGAGNGLKWDDVNNKWTLTELEGAYSNTVDRYVRWHKYNDSRNGLFAHEGGHHLHLGHVFGWQPETKADFQKLVNDIVTGGYTGPVANIFDGDGLSDTPADPGGAMWEIIAGKGTGCGNVNSIVVPYTNTAGEASSVKFTPDRTNALSYFFCNNFPTTLSPMQKNRAFRSVEFGNRNYLKQISQGISIPRYSYDINAVSWGKGRIDLLAAGSDLKVLHKAYNTTEGWVPDLETHPSWWSHQGEAVGIPTIVSWGKDRLDIFVRNADGRVKHQAWNGSSWYPSDVAWEDMGGTFAGDIAAVTWGPNRIDLFGRGYDGKIYHKAWDGQNWWPSVTGWSNLGGDSMTSDPVAVSWSANRLDIFVRGKSGDLLQKTWTGTQWLPSLTEWTSLGGQFPFGAKPAVTAWSANRLDIVMRGTDNALWHKAWDGSNWYGWSSLGGSITDDPAMVSWSANRLDIVVRGSDSHLYHKAWDGSNWWPNQTGWTSLGGWLLEGTRPKIISWGPGRLDIFIRNTNFEIQHKAYDGDWYPGLTLFETQGKYID